MPTFAGDPLGVASQSQHMRLTSYADFRKRRATNYPKLGFSAQVLKRRETVVTLKYSGWIALINQLWMDATRAIIMFCAPD